MEIIIILILILLNGVFAMSEIALISARKSRLGMEAKEGNRSAKTALRLAEDPDKFLSTVQIGITLIGILTGIYSGDTLKHDFAALLVRAGLSASYATPVAQATIVILVTYLTLIFGELVPKRIGMNAAETMAKLIARPMHALSVIASPFVWLLSKSSAGISHLLGLKPKDDIVTEDEIRSMVQEGAEDGTVREVEQDIVERVFALGDRKIGSIMTHRGDIVSIERTLSQSEINELVKKNLYEIYPVTDGSIDHVIGVVYLKDLFGSLQESDFNLERLIRPVQSFHENTDIYNALEQMRRTQTGYGLIFDEYGVLQGIVTLKDMLEGLIGTLPDSHEDPDIVQREDGSCLVDGQTPFYDFLAYFDAENLYKPEDYNTLSGLILQQLGRIPHTGEKLDWGPFHLEIVDMDGARIDKVLVTEKEQPSDEESESE